MDIAALSDQLNNNGQPKPTFRIGQMFSGTVSRLFSEQLATIETGQHTLVAKLETALSVGGRYLFHVQSIDGLPRLKVEPLSSGIPDDKYARALVQQLLRNETPFRSSDLMQAAERLKGEGRVTEVHVQLAHRAIEKQIPLTPGIWQTLKSAAHPQSLAAQLSHQKVAQKLLAQGTIRADAPDTSGLQTMLAALGRPAEDVLNLRTVIQADRQQFLPLLQQSLGFQLLNTDPSQGTGFLPFNLDGYLTDGFIQWQTHAHERGQEDASTRVLFFLKLQHLEETVLDLFIKEKNISVHIYNDHKEPGIVAHLKPVLAQKLEEQGFQLVAYHWNQTEKRAVTTEREAIGRGGFDVRI
ncbi:hypothetical protein HUG15_14260 [Salicibibacter cibarius]|uniref:Flagellar hook-length control protein FliK n=1 Tax=Salicibibacter cibarius TaxID=2743000 RepID=A0A7T6Z4D9_9BACI|nr:hypothetical protein [Salicibibacter cibarius]QQK76613.1 hypothetical protein HUG15_14260 [Salicibibacter cibarius]